MITRIPTFVLEPFSLSWWIVSGLKQVNALHHLGLFWHAAPCFPPGRLWCTRFCGRTSSPRWRTPTARMERTRPPRPDTPSCPSTTAGCSTLAAISSTRTAHACPPYPGDRGHIASQGAWSHTSSSCPPPPCSNISTNYMCLILFFFLFHHRIPFCLTLSLPLPSCLVLPPCVPCIVSSDGPAGRVTDDGKRK